MPIDRPFDILELRDGGQLVTRVVALDQGPVTVTPRDGRGPKVVEAVRLFVPMEDKQTAPPWWDVTSQTVKPTLVEVATEAVRTRRWVRVTKYGVGPGARFGVELLGADFNGPPRADTLNQAGP